MCSSLGIQDVPNLNSGIWGVRCLHSATMCATSSAALFGRHLTILLFNHLAKWIGYKQESMPASQGFQ